MMLIVSLCGRCRFHRWDTWRPEDSYGECRTRREFVVLHRTYLIEHGSVPIMCVTEHFPGRLAGAT